MLILVKGDLFKTNAPVIIHGCNCFCTMGKGIAKTIQAKYPEAYAADLKTAKGDRSKLGSFSFAKTKDDRHIVNLYTQYTFWDEDDMFYPDALKKGLQTLFEKSKSSEFALPAIGLGLANGIPHEVFTILDEVSRLSNKTLYLHIIEPALIQSYNDWSNRQDSHENNL